MFSGRTEAECCQPELQFLRNVLLRFASADPERAPHDFDEGEDMFSWPSVSSFPKG